MNIIHFVIDHIFDILLIIGIYLCLTIIKSKIQMNIWMKQINKGLNKSINNQKEKDNGKIS